MGGGDQGQPDLAAIVDEEDEWWEPVGVSEMLSYRAI